MVLEGRRACHMSDAHAQSWYFGNGSETERCSGEIDDYDGHMTMPPIMTQIMAEEGMDVGLFRAPDRQYGLGPRKQVTRP
jgi:hypothetical protein